MGDLDSLFIKTGQVLLQRLVRSLLDIYKACDLHLSMFSRAEMMYHFPSPVLVTDYEEPGKAHVSA